MADILAAFDELEKEDKKTQVKVQAAKPQKKKKLQSSYVVSCPTDNLIRKGDAASCATGRSDPRSELYLTCHFSEGARQTRPRSRPAPLDESALRPPTPGNDRSPSIVSARRISFAEPDRTGFEPRRIWIPTKTDSLASGFEYDPRIRKFNVKEEGWTQFNKE